MGRGDDRAPVHPALDDVAANLTHHELHQQAIQAGLREPAVGFGLTFRS